MKEEQKKLEFYRKTIFSYIEEFYANDDFIMSMFKKYDEINDKIIPLKEMAIRSKEIMDIVDNNNVTSKMPESILKTLAKSKEIMKNGEKMTSTKTPSLNDNEKLILPDIIIPEKDEMGYVVYVLNLETDDNVMSHFNSVFNSDIPHVLTQKDVDDFLLFIGYDKKF